jgi:hypothetical protein
MYHFYTAMLNVIDIFNGKFVSFYTVFNIIK